VSELQLNGYAIERAYERGRLVGVRLLKPDPPTHPPHTGAVYGCGGSDNQRHTTNHDPAASVGASRSPGWRA